MTRQSVVIPVTTRAPVADADSDAMVVAHVTDSEKPRTPVKMKNKISGETICGTH